MLERMNTTSTTRSKLEVERKDGWEEDEGYRGIYNKHW